MRKIRLREKMRVFTEDDREREREYQEFLELQKLAAEIRMDQYDQLSPSVRDYWKWKEIG